MGVPFECELCHFQNVARQDPDWNNPRDMRQLTFMRAANLDVICSRCPSTIALNRRRMWRDYSEADEDFDVHELIPPFGSEEVGNRVGMGIAIVTLKASLRPGLYARHLQYETMRKTATWYANLHNAGSAYGVDTLYAKDEKKLHATACLTSGEWYCRFRHGARLRMGEIKRQDEALSSRMILAILEELEVAWQTNPNDNARNELEEFACALLIAFGVALRGEEITMVSLKGVLETWLECTTAEDPHIMVTLHGRFKGETGLRWHCLPLALNNASKIPYKRWLKRLLFRRMLKEGRQSGWLFAKANGTRRDFSYYDPMLLDFLGKARENDSSIMSELANLEDFSLWRSPRSGATTEATVNGVPGPIIELMGRWRKKEYARGTSPGLAMRQVYTRVRDILPKLLQFNKAL